MPNLAQVARLLQGELVGDGECQLQRLSSLQHAREDSLCLLTNAHFAGLLKNLRAAAVILHPEHAALYRGNKVLVADPYLAYAKVSGLFAAHLAAAEARLEASTAGTDRARLIHPSAVIAASARLHPSVRIAAHSVVGSHTQLASGVSLGANVTVGRHCLIGENTSIDAGVCLHDRTRIGRECTIASGSVLGASGFGYAWDQQAGCWQRIEQLGGVLLGNRVDIGAACCIDRAALDDTIIGDGVKLDDQVMLAHNVQVGDHTIMAGCVAVAGSTRIGKYCRLGGRASVLGQLEIADNVIINALTCVTQSITAAGTYASIMPAKPVAKWRATLGRLNRLGSLINRVKRLENAVRQPSDA